MNAKRPQDRQPRPPARLVMTTPEHLAAFGLGIGLMPKAPGTFGTLWGVVLWWPLVLLPPAGYALAVAVLFVAGVWVCGRSAKLLALPDCPGIVFDEIVGFLIAAAPLLPALGLSTSAWWLAGAFVLFRIFDIAKPWPIRWLDQATPGGFGIMLDDAVAGIYAAAALAGVLGIVRLAA
jgi:phosphatidylglycerophosphatase A